MCKNRSESSVVVERKNQKEVTGGMKNMTGEEEAEGQGVDPEAKVKIEVGAEVGKGGGGEAEAEKEEEAEVGKDSEEEIVHQCHK